MPETLLIVFATLGELSAIHAFCNQHATVAEARLTLITLVALPSRLWFSLVLRSVLTLRLIRRTRHEVAVEATENDDRGGIEGNEVQIASWPCPRLTGIYREFEATAELTGTVPVLELDI